MGKRGKKRTKSKGNIFTTTLLEKKSSSERKRRWPLVSIKEGLSLSKRSGENGLLLKGESKWRLRFAVQCCCNVM